MPSRNIIKEYTSEQFLHVYNRGVEKRDIFLDNQDYVVFLGLLKKYLTGIDENKFNRHKFDNLAGKLDLLVYCLMPNHIHLLFYQHNEDAVTQLMRRLMTGYVMYFNARYKRVGTLFQGRYKASNINEDGYLHHISRYIHMNPKRYSEWQYSSLQYYLGKKKTPNWLKTERILELFDGDTKQYKAFLGEYDTSKLELSVLKWQLANDPEDT